MEILSYRPSITICAGFGIYREDPLGESRLDVRLPGLITRVNLDILWSKASGTVVATFQPIESAQKWRCTFGLNLALKSLDVGKL